MPNLLSRILLITSCCSFLWFSSLLQAQNLQAAQSMLETLQSEQRVLADQIKKLEADIATKQSELAKAKAKPLPGKEDLDAAEKVLAAAKAAHAANPSDMNETSLKNAELKRHLAERKYLKNSGEVSELQNFLQSAETELATLRNTLANTDSKITEQKGLVAIAADQAAANAEREKQLAAERKLAAEKQAKLQADEQAKNAELAAKQKAADEQKRLADEAAAKALAEKNAAEFAKQEAAKKSAQQLNGLQRMDDKAAVAQETARLAALSEKMWAKSKVNQVMYLRREGSEGKKSNTLRDIGHLQYRSELIAPAGKVAINIGFRKWDLEFSQSDAGQNFVFLYDQSNSEKPRLVYYLKNLE